jgi:hypothetical protein
MMMKFEDAFEKLAGRRPFSMHAGLAVWDGIGDIP